MACGSITDRAAFAAEERVSIRLPFRRVSSLLQDNGLRLRRPREPRHSIAFNFRAITAWMAITMIALIQVETCTNPRSGPGQSRCWVILLWFVTVRAQSLFRSWSSDPTHLGVRSRTVGSMPVVVGRLPPGTSPRTAACPGVRERPGPEHGSTAAWAGRVEGSSTPLVSCHPCLCRSLALAALPHGRWLCSSFSCPRQK